MTISQLCSASADPGAATLRPTGRRARTKEATRRAITRAAQRLFMERGYDQVCLREIAEAAEVSITTVFKHFTGKEALVFGQEPDPAAELATAVRERRAGEGVLHALRRHLLDAWLPVAEHPGSEYLARLVDSAPALRAHAALLRARHADALGAALADAFAVPHDDLACTALARFVLEITVVARTQPDRRVAVERLFVLLAQGWQPPPAAVGAQVARGEREPNWAAG